MSNIERLAEIVGGKAEIARMCGVSRSIITRHNKAGGVLPQRFRAPIVSSLRAVVEKKYHADDVDEILERAMEYLPAAVCPCCGQSIEGKVI